MAGMRRNDYEVKLILVQKRDWRDVRQQSEDNDKNQAFKLSLHEFHSISSSNFITIYI